MEIAQDSATIQAFMNSIRKKTPPYSCYICQKLYRSLSGLDYHLREVGHDENGKERSKNVNARPMNNTPKRALVASSRPKNKHRKSSKLKSSAASSPAPAKKETLTYGEAQRLVQVDLEGTLCRIPMSNDLGVVVANPPQGDHGDSDAGPGDENVDVSTTDGREGPMNDATPSMKQADSTAIGASDEPKNNENGNEPMVQNSDATQCAVPESCESSEGCRKILRRSCVSKGAEAKESSRPTEVMKKPRRTATSGASTSALPVAVVRIIEPPCRNAALEPKPSYFRFIEKSTDELDEVVEYDMDEEDSEWLEVVNAKRQKDGISPVSYETFEMLMDRLEKESFFESRRDGTNGLDPVLIDEDAVCCICNDGEAQNTNVILFCDMCNLAVHQECYGVPFIPEGQWLCRRCLNSPSCAVDCVLCPNKGGAFKQTENGQWAHVVCAMWIPEVQFANAVFLEPIDSINEIPGARWRLTCYICHRRGGACIQCVNRNCYTAFHATCAQHAGLYMKMEMLKKGGDVQSVRKVVYCDAHSPPSGEDPPEGDMVDTMSKAIVSNSATPRTAPNSLLHKKLQAERRLNAMAAAPIVNIPFVPDNKLAEISSLISIPKKSEFLQQLRSFWALKRQSRSGVPLLRRLQASQQSQKSGLETETVAALKEQLVHWQRLRHDLERSRLLIELIRKREKLKREALRMQQHMTDLQLQPLTVLLRRTLDQLQQKDPVNIFADPVSVDDVPDYLDIISHPMDFSTMRKKLESHEYQSIPAFAADFQLMYRNCMTYNAKDTIYYRAAVRLRDSGTQILRFARKQAEKAGIDPDTGMHVEPDVDPEKLDQQLCQDLSLAEQLEDLKEELEELKASSSSGKALRLKGLRKQMTQLRRQMNKEIVEKKLAAGVMTAEEAAVEVSDEPPPSSKLKMQKRRRRNSGSRPQKRRRRANDSNTYDTTADSSTEVDGEDHPGHEDQLSADHSFSATLGTASLACPEAGGRPQRNRRVSERMRETDDFLLRCATVTRSSSHDALTELPVSPTSVSPGGHNNLSPEDHSATAGLASSDSANNRGSQPVVSLPRIRRSPSNQSDNGMPADELCDDELPPSSTATLENGHGNSRPRSVRSCQLPPSERTASNTVTADPSSYGGADILIDSPSGRKKRRIERASSAVAQDRSPSMAMELMPSDEHFKHTNGEVDGRSLSTDSVENEDIDVGGETDLHEHVMLDFQLKPLDLVWAKCRGYPSYPALMIDPAMTAEEADIGGGLYLPLPPPAVLDLRSAEDDNLVLFFDARRTWQWLPRNKLAPLGVSSAVDHSKLTESRKPATRRSVSKAFDRALMHRLRSTTLETQSEES